jgi:hypothetical protein
MPLGTTDLFLRGDATNNGLYKEMDKAFNQTNVSLGEAQYGHNDYSGTPSFATVGGSSTQVNMSSWQNYSHDAMTFRFSPPVTANADTYQDLDPDYFGGAGQGIPYTNSGGFPGTPANTWDYPGLGSFAYGFYDPVVGGEGYKQGSGGIMVMCGWLLFGENGAGQTSVLGNDVPIGGVRRYRGYRMDVTTSNFIRVLRGDGGGTSSANRRTFQSSGTIEINNWNFVVWQGLDNSTTVGTSSNYMYIWNPQNGWQAGASFLSGGGGPVNYSPEDPWAVSPMASGAREWMGVYGGWYVFNTSQPSSNMVDLKDATRVYYGV